VTARELCDPRLEREAQVVAARLAFARGDFEGSASGWRLLRRGSFDLGVLGESRVGEAAGVLRQGHAARALELIRQSDRWLTDTASPAQRAQAQAFEALAHLELGNADAAARLAYAAFDGHAVALWWLMPSVSALAEVCLGLFERHPDDPNARRAARRAVDVARKLGDTFPGARPQALLWAGSWAARRGKRDKARQFWHNAIDAGTRLETPWECERARSELSRGPEDDGHQ